MKSSNGILGAAIAGALVLAPFVTNAASFCVASAGGFGSGGATFINPTFVPPGSNKCKAWSGFTKTASTVVMFSSGVACMAAGDKVLTITVTSADPSFFSDPVSDQIVLCPTGTTSCPVTGQDQGNFGGTATEVTCTTSLLNLPATHD